jgi:hypothetical protein
MVYLLLLLVICYVCCLRQHKQKYKTVKQRKLLGQILIKDRLITKKDLLEALEIQKNERQKNNECRLGQILMSAGKIGIWDLVKALKKQNVKSQ